MREKKRLKLSLAETFTPGQDSKLIRLLSSSKSDGEDDDDDEMDEMVKMYQANDSLSRISFFHIYCKLLPFY